ncbi:MAG: flavodoxin-dependent (E)-4-hydroxy-3-methylbut-2-enyl-diphosphate synthase [Coprobacillus sp.]|nr:flavodoxin-dependent (E)-4-hydroxy-3-methylbut-2-enyl-diphosphate synthase [Coprobacillus sp.]
MTTRNKTKSIYIGKVKMGGDSHILIQSMTSCKASNIDKTIEQINRCAYLGADLMRIAVTDEKDALAIKEIKVRTTIPLIADIHFDAHLALLVMDNGIDKIRINPGNISEDDIKLIVNKAREKQIPIRLGFNSGSLPRDIMLKDESTTEKMMEAVRRGVALVESLGFYDIVISAKCSDVIDTIKVNEMIAEEYSYPIHLGLTEAGPKDISLVTSSAALSPLLLEGIGNTIRISISGDPEEEVKAASTLLSSLGLISAPKVISCPTCGRSEIDVITLSNEIYNYLLETRKNITVSIMGCVVNGIGEAAHSNLGVVGEKGDALIYKDGALLRKVNKNDLFKVIKEEIDHY